jgi:hypothetical protein
LSLSSQILQIRVCPFKTKVFLLYNYFYLLYRLEKYWYIANKFFNLVYSIYFWSLALFCIWEKKGKIKEKEMYYFLSLWSAIYIYCNTDNSSRSVHSSVNNIYPYLYKVRRFRKFFIDGQQIKQLRGYILHSRMQKKV